jgi:hypothetical protein
MASRSRFKLIVAGLFVLALAWVGLAWYRAKQEVNPNEIRAIQALQVDYILTADRVNEIGQIRGAEFDVDRHESVLLAIDEGLLELKRAPDGVHVEQISQGPPDSFCLDGQGSLLSISQQYFGQLENNDFSQAVPLPYKNMRLAGSSLADATYAFGGDRGDPRRVYAFFADGTLQIEAQIPDNVVAVSDNSKAVYIASPKNIYRVTAKGIETVLCTPVDLENIVSIAVSGDDQELFFATDKETFLMSGLAAVAVLPDLGGTLRFRNEKLYVFSPVKKLLVAVSGLDDLVRKSRTEQ